MKPLRVASALALVLVGACATTGREPARAALDARGTAPVDVVSGSYTLRLTRADLAIGPLYLCATRVASTERCASAILETTDAYVFDALEMRPVDLGFLDGVTGVVRSAQYDHGIPFLLGAPAPEPLAPAEHTLVLEGTATDGVDSFTFTLDLDAYATVSGQTAVVGRFVSGVVPSSGGRLTVVYDPHAVVRAIPWSDVAALPRPALGPVRIEPGTLAHDVALIDLLVNHPVELDFSVDAAP